MKNNTKRTRLVWEHYDDKYLCSMSSKIPSTDWYFEIMKNESIFEVCPMKLYLRNSISGKGKFIASFVTRIAAVNCAKAIYSVINGILKENTR